MSEDSTPADAEDQLLAAGLRLVEADYLLYVRRGTPTLTVSANDHSSPALRHPGFEKVLQLRRLEDVLSGA